MKLNVLISNSILFLALLSAVPACISQDKIGISYIGNMGVLIGDENHAVLIDGLHKEYGPQYVFPSDSLVNKLIRGQYETYNAIDIIIASHRHGDHFDATYFHEFLDGNPKSIAILSPQPRQLIIDKFKGIDADVSNRIMVSVYDNTVNTFEHEDIIVDAFKCDHVNPSRHKSVENTAYIVNIKGISVLHVGDTNWGVAERHLVAHKELLKDLDVAILPYWMLLEENSNDLIERLIKPHYLIATHIPPDLENQQARELSNNRPGVVMFTEIGQKIDITERP